MALVDLALAIAADGFPVFPCGRTKTPAISKKNGGHGFHDAITDPEAVRVLFTKAPGAALIGVPTGEASGFDVLDLDYRHGAADWEREHGAKLPLTRSHSTKSGGKHLLFRHVAGVCNLASKFAPGMDVRGQGGYICMPPSPGYKVISDAPIAEWPDWLLSIIIKAEPAQKPREPPEPRPDIDSKRLSGFVDALARKVSMAGEGQKHFTLRNAAISLGGIQRQAGLSDHEAIKILVDALPSSVLDWDNAKATAAWGLEHGRERPIQLEDRPLQRKLNGNGHDTAALQPPSPHTFDGLDTNEPLRPESSERIIRVTAGLRHLAADAGLSAMMAAAIPFYQRDRSLVRAGVAKAKAADGGVVEVPSLVPVTVPILSRALGQSARWEKVNKDGEIIRIDPPKEVTEQIAAMFGEWPFPPISGVIGTPTMRPDGSLLLREGYDPATGLVLLSPPPMPPIPDHPSKTQALDALALLNSLLQEFPFGDDNVARSVAMSMLLTPVLRGALAPAVPMHMVTAPQPGTGKSYLQDIASMLATGERCAVVTVASDPQETEKRLIGAALAAFPIIALDNCNGVLTGDFLAQVTERPLLQLRPLGTSQVTRIANVFTVFANGNNISVAADLVRRTLLSGLDANVESPEMRTFTSDPLATIAQDRGRYVAACLTIARAYVCAGFPGRLSPLPSFERWSNLVRSALVWMNWDDPVAGTQTIRAEDPTRNARNAIFAGWAGCLKLDEGYLVGDIIKVAEDYDAVIGAYVNPDFRSALMDVAKAKNAERIDGKRLGWWLRASAKVVVGHYKLTVDRSNETHPKWSIQRV